MLLKITPTLINAYYYAISNEYDDKALEDLKNTLNKVEITNEAIEAGKKFEDDCYKGVYRDDTKEIISILHNGCEQVKRTKNINLLGYHFKLVGVADYVRGYDIYDIKKSISHTYTLNKYIDSAQHSAYFALFPQATRFTYLFNDKYGQTFKEQYLRSDVAPIETHIINFINGIKSLGLWKDYIKNWEVK